MTLVARREALGGSAREFIFVPPNKYMRDMDLSLGYLMRSTVVFIKKLFRELKRGTGLKVQLRVQVDLEKFSFETKRNVNLDAWFTADTETFLSVRDVSVKLQNAASQVQSRYDGFVERGSGWTLRRVIQMSLIVSSFRLFRGGSKISSIPNDLKRSRSCISVGHYGDGDDEMCFVRCVVAGIASLDKNPRRWCHFYDQIAAFLPVEKLEFPVDLKSVKRFEHACPLVSLNVYGFEKGSVFPLYLSADLQRSFSVNLLFYNHHYYLVRNLGALVRPQTRSNRRKIFVCPACLSTFRSSEKHQRHMTLCKKDGKQFSVPDGNANTLKFENYSSMLTAPFVVYCDMETTIREEKMVLQGKTISKRKHVPISVAAYVVCRSRPSFGASPYLYTGPDCVSRLLSYLRFQETRLRGFYENVNVPCRMTSKDERRFAESRECFMCRRRFEDIPHIKKVRDHCHLSGKYRFALCDTCNLTRAKRPFEVQVFFHGLSNYDSHFLVKRLGKYKRQHISVIPKNSEQYLAFSLGSILFRDSFQFLHGSLAVLVDNLKTKGDDCFVHLKILVPDPEKRKLLMRKGVFPYSYFDSPSVLKETSLPPIDAFRNDLDGGSGLSPESYHHAQTVWKAFDCRTFADYLHLYLLSDCVLLADVFENFRENCLRDYSLDPVYYFSSPHFTFDAFLRYTDTRLELLRDVDQYLFISRGIRGGLSMVTKRHSVANNRFLPGYDPSKPTTFILDFDANNLYGWAMRNPLPVSDFLWMNDSELTCEYIMSLSPEGDVGCIVECTMSYPAQLHELHADYPLAPYKKVIKRTDLSPYAMAICKKHCLQSRLNTEKLVASLEGRERYVLHYRNLQLYIRLGMQVHTFHKGVKFKQSAVIDPYVRFNTDKRAEADNDFDVAYYKLLLNSLYGKTIENPEKRTKVKLCCTPSQFERNASHHSFKRSKIISKDLVGVEMKYPVVRLNKPYPIGMTILELSKFHMFNFHYNVMKPIFGSRVQLLYTDTDSLVYEIESEDPYLEIDRAGKMNWFDFSNFPDSHRLFSTVNKRVPGTFKNECPRAVISEFVGLKSKMYSMRFAESKPEIKAAKGVKRAVIKNDLKFDHYLQCLYDDDLMEHEFKCIRSFSHSVHTVHQKKVSLSSFEDKRYLLDAVHSLPYGHVNIDEHLSKKIS